MRLDEIAKRGYEEGRSAQQVADDIFQETKQRVTRNSVCGRWFRMKLPKRVRTPIIKRPDPIPPPPRPKRHKRPEPAAFPVAFRAATPIVKSNVGRVEYEAPPTGVTISNLHPGACRWPLWRDNERPNAHVSRYCGQPTEHEKTSYCRHHRLKGKGSAVEL